MGFKPGNNIFQRSEKDALGFANALAALVYENKSVKDLIKIYKKQKKRAFAQGPKALLNISSE